MKRIYTLLGAAAMLAVATLSTATPAKAGAELLAGPAVMTTIFVVMVGGCELRYQLNGTKCSSTPAPAPDLGYNQRTGQAALPDGSVMASTDSRFIKR